jgi:hypothetical protein
MTSIIERMENEYIEPERPYSQTELKNNRETLSYKLRLSKTIAKHEKCGHFYYVLKNGHKEKEIIESNCLDKGNCSVCWKVNKIKNGKVRGITEDLIYNYCSTFWNEPPISYNILHLEKMFYNWLYEENTIKPKL